MKKEAVRELDGGKGGQGALSGQEVEEVASEQKPT